LDLLLSHSPQYEKYFLTQDSYDNTELLALLEFILNDLYIWKENILCLYSVWEREYRDDDYGMVLIQSLGDQQTFCFGLWK
jgi:uncharacterized membrane protein YoaT (DUF817 family)